jgi:hypothetical protein
MENIKANQVKATATAKTFAQQNSRLTCIGVAHALQAVLGIEHEIDDDLIAAAITQLSLPTEEGIEADF